MAFPTVPTAAASRILSTTNTAGGAAGVKTFPNLSSLTKNSGDLLIAICIIYDGNSTNAEFSSWGGGFTEFVDQAGTATMAIGAAYKWSTGSETGTFTVTTADTSTSDSVLILMSIAGAHASTPPEGGTMAVGTGTAANAASFNPTGWDVEDTLWIAVGGSGEDSTSGSYTGLTAAPTNYTTDFFNPAASADAVGAVQVGIGFRQLAAASEDVGAFTVDTSSARSAALTIAVRPAAPVPKNASDDLDISITESVDLRKPISGTDDLDVSLTESGVPGALADFPTVESTFSGQAASPTSSYNLTLPDNLATGDLVVVAVSNERTNMTWPGSPAWTGVGIGLFGLSTGQTVTRYRVIDGTEGWSGTGNSITITNTGGNSAYAHAGYVINGQGSSSFISASTAVAASGSGQPNPSSHSFVSDTIQNHLWLAVYGWDNGFTATHTSYPSSYTNGVNGRGTGSPSVGAAISSRSLAAVSENPGAGQLADTCNWVAYTIVVEPPPNSSVGSEPIEADDDLDISLTESGSVTSISFSGTDDLDISITEGAPTLAVSLSSTDNIGIAISETKSLQVNVNATDSLSVSVSETNSTLLSISSTDNLDISLSETSTILVTLSSTDSLDIGLSESADLDITLDVDDVLDIDFYEEASIDGVGDINDSLSVSISETSSVMAVISSTDSLNIEITDSGSVDTGSAVTPSAADDLDVSITESSSIMAKLGRQHEETWPIDASLPSGVNFNQNLTWTPIGNYEVNNGIISWVSGGSPWLQFADEADLSPDCMVEIEDFDAEGQTDFGIALRWNGGLEGYFLYFDNDSQAYLYKGTDAVPFTLLTPVTSVTLPARITFSVIGDQINASVGDVHFHAEDNEVTGASTGFAVLGKISSMGRMLFGDAISDPLTIDFDEEASIEGTGSMSDSLNIDISETSGIYIQTSASDSLDIAITESGTMTAQASASDNLDITLTEASSLYSAFTDDDDLELVLTESRSIAATGTISDSLNIELSETKTLLVSVSSTDSLNIEISDSGSVVISGVVNKNASDNLDIAIGETGSIPALSTSSTDSLDLSITETAAVQKTSSSTDILDISITETKSIAGTGSISDSLDIALSETTALFVTQSSTDSLDIALTETGNVVADIIAKNASDSLDITITDTVSTLQVSRSGNDSLDISLTESASSAGTMNRTDILDIALTESRVILVTLSRTDSLDISLSETANAPAALSRTDALDISLTESASIYRALSKTDTLDIALNEQRSVAGTMSRTDSLDIIVTDVAAVRVVVSSSDDLDIEFSETTDIETTEAGANRLFLFNGNEFVGGVLKMWNGSDWSEGTLRMWDGVDWVPEL